MKDSYDLTSVIDMTNFPWDEIPLGIAKSVKKASIFYGNNHNAHGLTPEQKTWYDSVVNSQPLKGLDILLTSAKSWHDAWYKLGINEHWTPTANLQYFPRLQAWLTEIKVFEQIGRQIIFIQLQHASTPKHVDQNLRDAPAEYQRPSEFIWITHKDHGKKLIVNNSETSHVTWFNSYAEHYTLPDSGLKWSVRIDGMFTDKFKKELIQL